MEEHPYVACVGLILFDVRAVFGVDSVYVGHCPFDRRSDWWCGGQSLPWLLIRASSLLCGCCHPVGSWVCSPAVGVEAPDPFLSSGGR